MSELLLYQMMDSNFPIGMFSHSFGFETFLQDETITSELAFKQWLDIFIKDQLVYNDFLAMRAIFEQGIDFETADRAVFWTRKLHAQTLAKEVRNANQKMGQQFLHLMQNISPSCLLEEYQQKLKQFELASHPAVVFTLVFFQLNGDLKTLLSTYGYSQISGLVQNGVRGIPIGQIAGQKLIFELSSSLMSSIVFCINELAIADFGLTSPALEIRQMQHEWLRARNFMS